MLVNDKLNFTGKELLGILLAAAATALCVIIDIVAKEDLKENQDNQTKGE